MAKLIYAMNVSIDGYTEDAKGGFNWGAGEDLESHMYICELVSKFRTHLYGRKIYDAMVYWETADKVHELPAYLRDFATNWRGADKIVYSKTLTEPRSQRTTIEREFDPDAVRRLKANAVQDINVAGPELAEQAIRAGLVDGLLMLVWPVVVGGGKRFLPTGIQMKLELVEERRLRNGVVVINYDIHS